MTGDGGLFGIESILGRMVEPYLINMIKGRKNIMHISYSDREYEKLRGFFERSSCQSMCEYGRKVLLHEPVIFRYRNGSMDDILEELVDMRSDLKALLDVFDRASQELPPGRRDPNAARMFDTVDGELRPGIARIMELIEKFWDEWLLNSVEGKASDRS